MRGRTDRRARREELVEGDEVDLAPNEVRKVEEVVGVREDGQRRHWKASGREEVGVRCKWDVREGQSGLEGLERESGAFFGCPRSPVCVLPRLERRVSLSHACSTVIEGRELEGERERASRGTLSQDVC